MNTNKQSKADFRKKTFQLIEKLDEQVQKLGIFAKLRFAAPSDYTMEEDMDGNMVESPIWDIRWKVDPQDSNTQSFMATLDELYHMLNSKEGVRVYPRSLYRELIEFSDKCVSCKEWEVIQDLRIAILETGTPTESSVRENARWGLKHKVDEFRKEIKAMIRSIYFYENERDDAEESFFEGEGCTEADIEAEWERDQ